MNGVKKNTDQKVARPFVKWVGGKSKLVPILISYFPDEFNNYYEPFVGGGALYFTVNPSKAYINDLNEVLINAYINIKDRLDDVISALRLIENEYIQLNSLETKKEFYLSKRKLFNQLQNDDFNKTILLIFINKTCFNGMYRENSKGEYNIPFGKHESPTICDEKNLRLVSEHLKKTTITQSSYEDAIKSAKKGDLIYFDPPYDPLNTTSSFTTYQAGGFTSRDQEKLRDTFKKLSDKGCYVMLSNSDTPLINELYKEFTINKIYASRSINSNGKKRGKVKEVLVTNYAKK